MKLRTACLLLAAASSARAAAMHLGVDVSTPVPAAAAACMKSQHAIDFAISRAWYSDGEGFDKSCVESGASFKAAGVAFDVYMCVRRERAPRRLLARATGAFRERVSSAHPRRARA
jgi:hypothetical protein